MEDQREKFLKRIKVDKKRRQKTPFYSVSGSEGERGEEEAHPLQIHKPKWLIHVYMTSKPLGDMRNIIPH